MWKYAKSKKDGGSQCGQWVMRKDSDNSSRRGVRWCTGLGYYRYKHDSEECSPC
jgi:hypothetical protein